MSTTTSKLLPPGQYEIEDFPRFGLDAYADRYRKNFDPLDLKIVGDVEQSTTLRAEDFEQFSSVPVSHNLASQVRDSDQHGVVVPGLERVEQTSDFHCVTTWSKTGLVWSGFRFKDFYEKVVLPQNKPAAGANYVICKAQDGYRTLMLLEDMLKEDVLLADRLNGKPLCSLHGAPLRLVAPAHYGFKSLKHLKSIGFYKDDSSFKGPTLGFMMNLRGRVEFEERGTGVPGWILRRLYRPLVNMTIRKFKKTQSKIDNAN